MAEGRSWSWSFGVAVLVVVVAAAAAAAGEGGSSSPVFPALVVFGDSLVDVGTNNHLLTIIKGNFLPYGRDLAPDMPTGRFSNGLLLNDYLALDLGLPFPIAYLDRNGQEDRLLQGVNFASSGSGWFNLTADQFNVLSIAKQVAQFKDYKGELTSMVGEAEADRIVSGALYVFGTGVNDYLNSYLVNPLLQAKYSLAEYQDLIVASASISLKDLYDAGARNIVVSSLPPFGCLPSAITLYGLRGLGPEGCVTALNDIARRANGLFEQLLSSLQAQLPGSTYLVVPGFQIFLDVFANPAAFGYKQTRLGCCGSGTFEVGIFCTQATVGTCENADDYVFFDAYHPTSRFYKQIHDDVLQPALKQAFNL